MGITDLRIRRIRPSMCRPSTNARVGIFHLLEQWSISIVETATAEGGTGMLTWHTIHPLPAAIVS